MVRSFLVAFLAALGLAFLATLLLIAITVAIYH
jgi:hypothetical protein